MDYTISIEVSTCMCIVFRQINMELERMELNLLL